MKKKKLQIIRLFKKDNEFKLGAIDVSIESLISDSCPTGTFIDSDVDWVIKEMENMLMSFAWNRIDFDDTSNDVPIILRNHNNQYFMVHSEPVECFDCSYMGSLPIDPDLINTIITRTCPIQDILSSKDYPVAIREYFITGEPRQISFLESCREQFDLTGFKTDPLFIDLDVLIQHDEIF
jgi:hypothetical protein